MKEMVRLGLGKSSLTPSQNVVFVCNFKFCLKTIIDKMYVCI